MELVRYERRGGIDFNKLDAARRRFGLEAGGERWPPEVGSPAYSRQVLGLNGE